MTRLPIKILRVQAPAEGAENKAEVAEQSAPSAGTCAYIKKPSRRFGPKLAVPDALS